MTRAEYEAIRSRAAAGLAGSVGSARVALICVDIFGNAVHPDGLGAEAAAEFKTRAESFALASRDRAALVKFIEDGFDIEWPDETERGAEPCPG